LYDYIAAVQNAKRYVKSIALEVRVTSSTLETLGTLLQDHDAGKLCTNDLRVSARAAFEGRREAFTELDETFKPMVKVNSGGKSLLSTMALPYKMGKMEALQANLERLKTTLLLMLSVLSFAREKAKKCAIKAFC